MILKSTLLNVTLIYSIHCFADFSLFDNYACIANTKSDAQSASELDALHFISLLNFTAWHQQKHIVVLGLELLFFQRKYNGHSAHFFLLLYTDEYTFHGIAPYHSWCPRTKFLTD
jgi:hypothetical protein